MNSDNRYHPAQDVDGLTRAQRLDLMLDLLMLAREELGITQQERPMTLREIGDVLGMCHERIRQIEEDAIGKMKRAAARRKQLVNQTFAGFAE